MRIYIPKFDEKAVGGGWTFLRSLIKYIKSEVSFAHTIEDCDIMFIPGPTLAERADVEKARQLEKRIVLRVDNIPEDYRNRGTAVSRLKDFSRMADAVVYQSNWARDYVMSLTHVDGAVIYNGVNRDIFNPVGRAEKSNQILYVRSSTNENKRWQEAKYYFREYWKKRPELIFTVVGNFADYVKLYGEDFEKRYHLGLFDEPHVYYGKVPEAEAMAEIYRGSAVMLAPYYNDACSNIILEARACGCEVDMCLSGNSGGTPEIMALDEALIGADRMAKEYLGLFKLVMQ